MVPKQPGIAKKRVLVVLGLLMAVAVSFVFSSTQNPNLPIFSPAMPHLPPRHVGACNMHGCDFCRAGEEDEKKKGICTTCNDKDQNSHVVTLRYDDPFFGWLCCECDGCQRQCRAAKDTYTYPHAKLLREFPEGFRVRRSNGTFDPPGTWRFSGNGWFVAVAEDHEEDPKTIQLVILSGVSTSKRITLADLRAWQKINRCN